MSRNYYDIIGLPLTASQAEIDQRLAQMAQRQIPEHLRAAFVQMQKVLGNPQQRRAYDAALAAKSGDSYKSSTQSHVRFEDSSIESRQEAKVNAAPVKSAKPRLPPENPPLAKEKSIDFNPYQAPSSSLGKLRDEEAPPLFNPNAAGLWSILFSPLFGSYLHWQNCLALDDEEGVKAQKGVFYVVLVFLIIAIFGGIFVPAVADKMPRSMGLTILVIWWFAAGKKHKQAVQERFGDDYPRRSMGKAVLMAVGILIAAVVLIFIVVFIAMAFGIVE